MKTKSDWLCWVFLSIGLCILAVSCVGDDSGSEPSDAPIQSPDTFDSPTSPLSTPVKTPTAEPTLTADINVGTSREQPAPLGTAVVADDGLWITVIEVRRDAAEELVNMNPFNTPRSDEEVVIVRVRVRLPEDPASSFVLLPLDFDIVDSAGNIYPYPLTVIVEDELTAEFRKATTREGLLAFRIPEGLDKLFLRYAPKDRDQIQSPRWLALQ